MAITIATRLSDFGSGIGTQGAVLQVDNTNNRLGVGTTSPQAMLQVGTGVSVYGNSGIVSATTLSGSLAASNLTGALPAIDGSALTGIAATDNINTNNIKVSGISTFGGVVSITDSTESTSTTTGALKVTGGVGIAKSLHVGGNVSIAGTLTYEDVTNVDSVGIITAGKGFRATTGGLVVTAGVTTFNQDVQFSGTAAGVSSVTWDASANSLDFVDKAYLRLGTGNDLRISHDGANPYIDQLGTPQGSFYIRNNDAQFIFQAKMDENSLILKPDGAVEAYFDNSKKLETVTGGATVTGTLTATALVGRHGAVTTVTKSSGYTLADGDQGKMIITDSDVTVPENIFAAGTVITVCNSSGSSIDIIKGTGINLYTVGSSTNATAALAEKGIAVITCFASNDFIVGGGGVG